MKKFLLILGLLTPLALGQEVRYDFVVTTTGNPVSGSSAPAGSLVPILGVSGAGIKLCVDGTCATPLVTYTDATGTTPCPSNAQLTRPPLTTCFATADPQGNFGAWMPGNTAFFYKATAVYGTFGPYPVTSPGNGSGGGNPPVNTGTSQFANNGATAFFSGGVVNTDALGGIPSTFSSSSCVLAHCATIVPPTSSDTTTATVFSQIGHGSSYLQDLRANANGQYFVNPGLGFNAASIFGPSQDALPQEVLYTEPSPAAIQGSGQGFTSTLHFDYSPGYSLGPGLVGCPFACPSGSHTGAADWSQHGGYFDFMSFNGSGINNSRGWFANQYATGDTQLGVVSAEFLNYMGGWVAPSDEGAHMLGSVHAGNAGDYQGTLTTIVDANHIVTSGGGNVATIGQGRFYLDISNPVVGTDSVPLNLIDTDLIRQPGESFPYGTVVSNNAHFPVSYALGTLTNDCTVPVQEGGVAVGQNSGVNGCQITVTSGTFDTASPVCMAQNKWNLFDIGIQVSAVTALSGGHQTLTGTMHRSVTAGAYVFQGGMCGTFIGPQGDGTNETDSGQFVNGSIFPIIGSLDAHTIVYVNYRSSQTWGAIPNNGSQWGSTDTNLTFAAKGLQAINLVRTGGTVNGLLTGAGVSSSDRYQMLENALFFTVSGCSDTTFNGVIGSASALPGPFPNASNENTANISYGQAGQPDSTCASATIVPINHQMTLYWGAEIYDVVDHATGQIDGPLTVSYQPNFATGHTMDVPPHYAVEADNLNLVNEFGTPGQTGGGLTLININRSAINGIRGGQADAAITFVNASTPNETLAEGGQGRPTGFAYIQGYAGSWLEGTVAPGPGNYMMVSGGSNGTWVNRANIFHRIGVIGLDKVGADVPTSLIYDEDAKEWDWNFNFSQSPTFSINPNQITSFAPLLAQDYRIISGANGFVPAAHFKQCTPIPSNKDLTCFSTDVEPTAVVTNSGTPGSTRYNYILFWNDAVGPAFTNGLYFTVTGNATLSGSNFNNIPCTDLPAGASGGEIYIFINPGMNPVGACPNSSTVVHDTGVYGSQVGNNPLVDGRYLYSGGFAATGLTGSFSFTQPDIFGSGSPASTITAGLSQPSAGVVSVDTTAVGNGLGTLKAGEIIVAPSSGPSTLQMGVNLFATLPACASGTEGTQAAVSDSTTNTWGATITGSGTNHVLGYCDGTNWTVMAK